MEVEELGTLCSKKFTHFINENEKNFDHLATIQKLGNTKAEILQGLLWKVYDESIQDIDVLVEKFPDYFIEVSQIIKAKDFEIKASISEFHENLILFECDFPEFHNYYSVFLIKLVDMQILSGSDIDFKSSVLVFNSFNG